MTLTDKLADVVAELRALFEKRGTSPGHEAEFQVALRNNADLLLTAASCASDVGVPDDRGQWLRDRKYWVAPELAGKPEAQIDALRAALDREITMSHETFKGYQEQLSRALKAEATLASRDAELARCREALESERQRHADAEIKYHETLEFIRATNVVKGLNHLANMTIAQTSTEGKPHDE